jgi:deoxyribodipyrimidine photo-lyase
MKGLVWFRKDLRTDDQPALSHACNQCTKGLIALYIITPKTWKRHHRSACQSDFILKHLKSLSNSLNQLKIPLFITEVPSFQEIPEALFSFVKKYKIDKVFFNQQYEWDEKKCDENTVEFLKNKGCQVLQCHDQTIIPFEKLMTQKGKSFKTFTPFKRAWINLIEKENHYLKIYKPGKSKLELARPDNIPSTVRGFENAVDISGWPIGEILAKEKLMHFCQSSIKNYDKNRDYPALNASSQISPYLAIGVLSAKQCLTILLDQLKVKSISDLSSQKGPATWLSELIWREFYRYILYFFPRVSMSKPFLLWTDQLKWSKNSKHFKAWCEGKTGIPIIDAAMRCLNQTGWMHNRLRMITAMFLSKNLFQDWRKGEAYFMAHLLDGDFASNNGGWQWCASTGTDAAPYFRIFNPILQSQKFDPKGKFIRQFCPELADLKDAEIHAPFENKQIVEKYPYPKPIVDLKQSRIYAIEQYKKLRQSGDK